MRPAYGVRRHRLHSYGKQPQTGNTGPAAKCRSAAPIFRFWNTLRARRRARRRWLRLRLRSGRAASVPSPRMVLSAQMSWPCSSSALHEAFPIDGQLPLPRRRRSPPHHSAEQRHHLTWSSRAVHHQAGEREGPAAADRSTPISANRHGEERGGRSGGAGPAASWPPPAALSWRKILARERSSHGRPAEVQIEGLLPAPPTISGGREKDVQLLHAAIRLVRQRAASSSSSALPPGLERRGASSPRCRRPW